MIRRIPSLWHPQRPEGGCGEGADDETAASSFEGDRPRVSTGIEEGEGKDPDDLHQADKAEPRVCQLASEKLGQKGMGPD